MKKFNLNAEVICDYLVTEEMKKVWKVQLELLEKFIEVCDKHELDYSLTAGSLLGAVRHKGFIPWDDDIDVAMLRDDYNKLLKIADKEFKKPYFFQTPYNDNLFRGHAQLRNSNTTGILEWELNQNKNLMYNQGIFIDIFPIDNVPNNKLLYEIQRKRVGLNNRILSSYYSSNKNFLFKTLPRPFIKLIGYKRLYKHYEKVCSKYSYKKDGDVGCISFIYNLHGDHINKEYYNDLIDWKFEYLHVKIPREYDKILKKRYGNYMKFKKGGTLHGGILFEPDIPYKEYIKKLKNNCKNK